MKTLFAQPEQPDLLVCNQSYFNKLIAGGIDPSSAANIARKTAKARASGSPSVADQIQKKTAPETAVMPASPPCTRDPVPTKKTRKRDEKIIDAAGKIATDPPSGQDMAFMHAIMCQIGLPVIPPLLVGVRSRVS